MPAEDATAVARLKAAGAIVFGKTNLPLYAGDLQTYNEVYGRTNNPWDPDRGAFVDPRTKQPLRSWAEALDDLEDPAYVARLGRIDARGARVNEAWTRRHPR